MGRKAKGLLEQPTEMELAHIEQNREIGQLQISIQVGINVVQNLLQMAGGKPPS